MSKLVIDLVEELQSLGITVDGFDESLDDDDQNNVTDHDLDNDLDGDLDGLIDYDIGDETKVIIDDDKIDVDFNDEINEDFELFILSIKISDSGDITSTESTEPVSRIEIDSEHQEFLFHVDSEINSTIESDTTNDAKSLNIAKTKQYISSINSDYFLCSAKGETIDDSYVRIDNPIIGFGENIELKRFFLVCEA